MRKTIFLLGPTVNLPQLNVDTFRHVAERLRHLGHLVIIPHDLFFDEESGLKGMTVDAARERMRSEMDNCDAVVIVGEITAHEPFAWPLLLHARRQIMQIVPMDRITIDLKPQAA
jgi:hypothetical protein